MILPQTHTEVLILMILGLLCLGSWASMFKFAGKWRFELFYFDFAIGVMVTVLICAFTVGNLGFDGFNFLDDLQHAGKRQWLYGFVAGAIFNLANLLLMGAVSVNGMAVAFPAALGIAVVMRTAIGLLSRSPVNGLLVVLGCLLLLTSVLMSSMAGRFMAGQRFEELARSGKAKSTRRPSGMKGTVLAAISGVLMGSFTPLMDMARVGDLGLGPYALGGIFTLGMFISTPVLGIFLMNLPVEGEPLDFMAYFNSRTSQHVLGFFGGLIWCIGLLADLVVSSVPEQLHGGMVTRYLLSHGAPVIAALWGMLVFREFKAGDVRLKVMGFLMLVLFLCGLGMISLAPLYTFNP